MKKLFLVIYDNSIYSAVFALCTVLSNNCVYAMHEWYLLYLRQLIMSC